MAQVFSTGPVMIGIANNTAAAPTTAAPQTPALPTGSNTTFYGTTQTGPDITEEPSYFNVMNDLAGPNLPLSRGYAGSEHTITLVMTRWDGRIDDFLSAGPVPAVIAPGGTGSEGPTTRGRLDVGVQVLMVLSNSPGVGPDGLFALSRRYFRCIPIGPNKPIWGNKENIRVRVFKAQAVFIGASYNTIPLAPGARAWALFDETAAALPVGWPAFNVT